MQHLKSTVLTFLALAATGGLATEFHVAPHGDDANRGTSNAPVRTIQRAAGLAQPGDVITVHEGVYRERVNPPRGGTSERARILYQAAPGEKVEIKGSEIITNWTKVQEEVWKVTLPNSFFGGFNPYRDLIHGDWFDRRGRDHHPGAVYLNGDWLTEATSLDEVLRPGGTAPLWLSRADDETKLNPQLWFAQVDATHTTLWAQFKGVNPNTQTVEINVRQTVFYPDQPGRNFITVRGFTMRHAATPWAPPTTEQIGLLGTHWSRGWIIENNVVSHSSCSGIALGKHGDKSDLTPADTPEGFLKAIQRARAHRIPWTKESIGHHLVRDNTISHCEQAGIVGSLGAIFSTITGNVIHDIHVRRLFSGAEMGGIKLHAALDTLIRGNHIYRSSQGLWLDWMAQGTRVSGNLFHDNLAADLFLEVNHGPFVVDNNLFLSATSLWDLSEGGAFAHNLFAGGSSITQELGRQTPYHPAHATTLAGLSPVKGGDHRYYNNLFVGSGATVCEVTGDPRHRSVAGYGLLVYDSWMYDPKIYPLQTGGNLFYHQAQPYGQETNPVVLPQLNPAVKLVEQGGQFLLRLTLGPEMRQARTVCVTTRLLGQAKVPRLPYQDADGSALNINTDYFGHKRSETQPTPGPFENPGSGPLALQVWPVGATPSP